MYQRFVPDWIWIEYVQREQGVLVYSLYHLEWIFSRHHYSMKVD